MLGLGSGITSVSAPSSRVLLETYTADWSSDTDEWISHSGNDVAATLTHGVTFEGKSNALRVEFNANETGVCGVRILDAFSTTMEQGDYVEVTCDIYLDSAYDSLTDLWTGTDNVTTGMQLPGASTDYFSVAQNTWVSLSTPSEDLDGDLVQFDTNDQIIIFFNQGDLDDSPKDGARFYVHNFVAKLYRSQLFT